MQRFFFQTPDTVIEHSSTDTTSCPNVRALSRRTDVVTVNISNGHGGVRELSVVNVGGISDYGGDDAEENTCSQITVL